MSEKSERRELSLVYEYVKCGALVALEELELRGGRVKCTHWLSSSQKDAPTSSKMHTSQIG